MTYIELHTIIAAPIGRVFDLTRSIEFHQVSTPGSSERAIAGRTTGLIEQGETVTWRARHLGVMQNLTTVIPEMESPDYFCDVMQKGAFKSLRHEHYFSEEEGRTTMIDKLWFESPFGPLGKLFNWLFLKGYMARFLQKRATIIKDWAESERWKEIPEIKG